MASPIKDIAVGRKRVERDNLAAAPTRALHDRLRPLQERFAARKRPGSAASDTAFCDDISDNA